jgi:hypothetical protein
MRRCGITIILSLCLVASDACTFQKTQSGSSSLASSLPGTLPANETSIINETPTSAPTTPFFPSVLLPSMVEERYQDAPLTINKQSNGQIIHANLVKFIGSVPSLHASVSVNNIPVTVDNEGNYAMLLDLVQGKNVIEIKTGHGTDINTDDLTVTFEPPLVVLLDYPSYDTNTDYRQTPLTVTGIVTNPAAEVMVYQANDNSTRASVAANGIYSAQMLLKDIPPDASGFNFTAVAKLGNETDITCVGIGFKDGKLNDRTLGGPYDGTNVDIEPYDPITIVAGNTVVLDYMVNTRVMDPLSDDFPSSPCHLNIVRMAVDEDGKFIEQPPVPGLATEIMPSEFTTFPNTRYHVTIKVTTSSALNPDTYYLGIQSFLNSGNISSIISIIVRPQYQ